MTVLAAQRCYADRPGPWLVWLHGLWGNKEEWLTAAAEAGNYPSLLIDLRVTAAHNPSAQKFSACQSADC